MLQWLHGKQQQHERLKQFLTFKGKYIVSTGLYDTIFVQLHCIKFASVCLILLGVYLDSRILHNYPGLRGCRDQPRYTVQDETKYEEKHV